MLSPTGQAIPANLFAPGITDNGFTVPQSAFFNNGSLIGEWQFLGTTTMIPSAPPTCADSGTPGNCSPTDLEKIFKTTLKTITYLSSKSVEAGRTGGWRPKGDYRGPYYTRGATALRRFRGLIDSYGPTPYICEASTTATQCATKKVNKTEIRQIFNTIFNVKTPSGLAKVKALVPGQKRSFESMLATIPNTVTVCTK